MEPTSTTNLSTGGWSTLTLQELLETVAEKDDWNPNRIRNTRTAVRKLAKGLGKSSPEEVTEADYTMPVDDLIDALDRAQNGQGQTVKNNRNFLRYLFRRAEELDLITPLEPAEKQMGAAEAEKAWKGQFNRNYEPYRIKIEDWPPNLKAWWQWNLQDMHARLSPATIESYQIALELYIGYLHQSDQLIDNPSAIYDHELCKSYVNWHAKRQAVRGLTRQGENWLYAMLAADGISEDTKESLRKIRRNYPRAESMHDKASYVRNLKLQDLESVGLALMEEARKAYGNGTGTNKASAFRDALMLRLLVRRPIRNRNLREMKLNRNLYQDEDGQWWIKFRGEELKVTNRQGDTNEYHVPWPDDLTEELNEWLNKFRPRLTQGSSIQNVFVVGSHGSRTEAGEMDMRYLSKSLQTRVYQYTGEKFTPHLARTMFGTEMAQQNVDVRYVAYMLNDEIATVWTKYYEEIEEGITEYVDSVLSSMMGKQAGNGTATETVTES